MVGTRCKHFAILALTSANHVYVTNKILFDNRGLLQSLLALDYHQRVSLNHQCVLNSPAQLISSPTIGHHYRYLKDYVGVTLVLLATKVFQDMIAL
jgi:hypothetical protein